MINTLHSESSFPSEIPIKQEVHKLSLVQPMGPVLDHLAAQLLLQYTQQGCPEDCRDHLSKDQILTLFCCDPHPLAKSSKVITQLQANTKDKVKHHYDCVIKWKEIKDNLLPKLKINPVAMIPHKSKAFRCILNLSFNIKYKGRILKSVNKATTKMVHHATMTQLGSALKQIVALVANTNSPFYFTKLDIKDGFWQMAVSNNFAWNFCYMLPLLNQHRMRMA